MNYRQCRICGKVINRGCICFECVQKKQTQLTEARQFFGMKTEEKTMSKKELTIECDMLQGNINRMMTTESRFEVYEMYYQAVQRLGILLRENRKRCMAIEGSKELSDPFGSGKLGG